MQKYVYHFVQLTSIGVPALLVTTAAMDDYGQPVGQAFVFLPDKAQLSSASSLGLQFVNGKAHPIASTEEMLALSLKRALLWVLGMFPALDVVGNSSHHPAFQALNDEIKPITSAGKAIVRSIP